MSRLTGIDITEVSTQAKAQVGQTHVTLDGKVFQYVKATSAISQYDFVAITADGLFTAAPLTTTLVAAGKAALIGCAQVAIASGSYGWVQRKGLFTGKSSAAIAAGSPVHPTATSGSVDDTSTTARISGCFAVSAIGSATTGAFCAPAEMYSSGVA